MASLLRLQENHISEVIFNEETRRVLRARKFTLEDPHPSIIDHLRRAGFYHASQIRRLVIQPDLISALVERWRPETHTFHFPCGECTVTLEDVALQLGLPIHGDAVTGGNLLDWNEVCQDLLGEVPPEDVVSGSTVRLTWLKTFQNLPLHATEQQIQYAARAYILRLIGGLLMPDKSSSRVHLMYLPLLRDLEQAANYSWGSACLAVLYRELCRATVPKIHDIGGCLVLLQSWAWYRLPFLAPRVDISAVYPLASKWSRSTSRDFTETPSDLASIRLRLDRLGYDKFLWMPYSSSEIMACLPSDAYNNFNIWKANTALICFSYVEWHQTDRVLRQFGMQQPIPAAPMNLDKLHKVDMRGRNDEFWPAKHEHWIQWWNIRFQRIPTGYPIVGNNFNPSADYIRWYRNEGRPFVCPPSMHEDVRSMPFTGQTSAPVPPTQDMDAPRPRRQRGRRRQPTSSEFTAPRMSFDHPKPERDHGVPSSHHYSVSHPGYDVDECYRPSPPRTRLDDQLPVLSPSSAYLTSMYQFGTPSSAFDATSFMGASSSQVPIMGQLGVGSSSSGFQIFDTDETTDDIQPEPVAVIARGRGGPRIRATDEVERQVQPPRTRRARHCCSTPRNN